jgi:hypothetical protein
MPNDIRGSYETVGESLSPPKVLVTRLYSYVGPSEIAARERLAAGGHMVGRIEDVDAWLRDTNQEIRDGSVIATFVIDDEGRLRIADRRSEHVACATGRPVRSAGELTFAVGPPIEIVEVSNQSTGYCPEPESWPAVAAALSAAGFTPPAGFNPACLFRRCPACANITLIKDNALECGICGQTLPAGYNVD